MEDVDSVVIGAGVIGLATARALARQGREVLILEAAESFGTGISARNSEVIHAGLYYPPGSRKARTCVTGRRALMAYCHDRGIPHAVPGKLVVATAPEQLDRLDAIARRAEANGVQDLRRLDGAQARDLEPALHCLGALHVPVTGLVDSHALMQALLADAEDAGAMLVCHTPVTGGRVDADGLILETGGPEPMTLRARRVVNAAGLDAARVAASLTGGPPAPAMWWAKGSYFSLSGKSPFRHLIYPVPEDGGLGIHLTLDLAGRARFGPDVQWCDAPDYQVDPGRRTAFAAAIRRYWPDVDAEALMPDYAGVRPKRVPAGQPAADFDLRGPGDHGVPGLVHLFGIESPGLTAALALADDVAAML